MSSRAITVSTQIKSANTSADIKNHSGKENRGEIKHKNENINPELSKYNEVFNIGELSDHRENLRALQHKHYDKRIESHNYHNKAENRQWDMDTFLETFEGKQVGNNKNNVRWSTASQISYLGGVDSLTPVLKEIEQAGATQEEIRQAYTKGYGNYIEQHNETFETLPIYRSDLHFDETVPHGHDAILVKGHTKNGVASESINSALAEHYNNYGKGVEGNKENMEKYRDDNDSFIYSNITPELEQLAEKYGLDIEFEPIRTGAEGGKDMRTYMYDKDIKKLEEKAEELEDTEIQQGHTTTAQKKNNNRLKEKNRELNSKEENLDQRSISIDIRERELEEKEKNIDKKLNRLGKNTQQLDFDTRELADKDKEVNEKLDLSKGILLTLLKDDTERKESYDAIKGMDNTTFTMIPNETLTNVAVGSMSEMHLRNKTLGTTAELQRTVQEHTAPPVQDDGPEM